MSLVHGTWPDAEALVGRPLPAVAGADAVSAADFRRLLEALTWDSAIHCDDAAARDAGYEGVVSPRSLTRPAALPAYWTPGDPDALLGTVGAPLATLPGEGTAMVGTGNRFEYLGDVYPGDRLRTTSVLQSVTRKRTRLGEGAFLVLESGYYNQDDVLVARETATGFRYEPADTGTQRSAAPARPCPPDGESGLPTQHLTLTLQRLLMAAAVTRDFTPIHTVPDVARATGAPSAFANVTLCEALVERAVRGWIGQQPRITSLETRIVGFACAGDELSITGRESPASGGFDTGRQIAVVVSGPSGAAILGDVGVDAQVPAA